MSDVPVPKIAREIGITRIRPNQASTVAEEAREIGIRIQREIVFSVKNHRKVFILAGGALLGYLLLSFVFAALFLIYPLQTSDFFGYYYRVNSANKKQARASVTGNGNVLAAETGPVVAANPIQTTVLADVVRPVVSAALIAVKAVDDPKYIQIVTSPAEATDASPGLQGPVGPAGADGHKWSRWC